MGSETTTYSFDSIVESMANVNWVGNYYVQLWFDHWKYGQRERGRKLLRVATEIGPAFDLDALDVADDVVPISGAVPGRPLGLQQRPKPQPVIIVNFGNYVQWMILEIQFSK